MFNLSSLCFCMKPLLTFFLICMKHHVQRENIVSSFILFNIQIDFHMGSRNMFMKNINWFCRISCDGHQNIKKQFSIIEAIDNIFVEKLPRPKFASKSPVITLKTDIIHNNHIFQAKIEFKQHKFFNKFSRKSILI